MREMLQRIKADIILSALLCVALGVVLLIWPDETIGMVCKVLAVGLVILGAVDLFSYFSNKLAHPFSGILGLVVLLVGVWIFLRPESVVSLIPIVIGVILAIHGIQDIKQALEVRKNGYDRWWVMLIIAAVSLVLGVLCIVKAFRVVTLSLQFIGIALIYDGISDLWIAMKAIHTAKLAKQEAEAVDVEYRETDEK